MALFATCGSCRGSDFSDRVVAETPHPGVYIEEIGAKPIESVATSTAAFIGETERGSTKPRLITSYQEYKRWFGGVFGDTKFLPYAVSGFFDNGGDSMYVCRVANDKATPAEVVVGNFTVRAVGPGSWGTRVYVRITDSSTQVAGADGKPAPMGFQVLLGYYTNKPTPTDLAWFADPSAASPPPVCEIFDDLESDETSPNYWFTRLNEKSALAELVRNDGAPAAELPVKGPVLQLDSKGTDGDGVSDADYAAALATLERNAYDEVALVYAPGVSVSVNREVIQHCERQRYRFAVVDPDESVDVSSFQPRIQMETGYAALYYPWIAVSDPLSGARRIVPPGGHVLGVYARTDSGRGVFKAPANEALRGVIGLTVDISNEMQNSLNPRGINAIRQFPGRGTLVWGARTLSSDDQWKYVSVRRLFIFLEHSIYKGTQWVVFEPNNESLWARVSDAIRLFLRAQWRIGALSGRTEDEAFFVRCDRTTMTQDDIVNGRLICEVGVAPVRPAEFVIFRICQNTADAA